MGYFLKTIVERRNVSRDKESLWPFLGVAVVAFTNSFKGRVTCCNFRVASLATALRDLLQDRCCCTNRAVTRCSVLRSLQRFVVTLAHRGFKTKNIARIDEKVVLHDVMLKKGCEVC